MYCLPFLGGHYFIKTNIPYFILLIQGKDNKGKEGQIAVRPYHL